MKEICKEGIVFVWHRIAQIVSLTFMGMALIVVVQSFLFTKEIEPTLFTAVCTALFLNLFMMPLNDAIKQRSLLRRFFVFIRIVALCCGIYVLIRFFISSLSHLITILFQSLPTMVEIFFFLIVIVGSSWLIGRLFLAVVSVMDNDATVVSALRHSWVLTRHNNILMTLFGLYIFYSMFPLDIAYLSPLFTLLYYVLALPFSVFLYLKLSGKQPVDDASIPQLAVNPITRILINALSIAWFIYIIPLYSPTVNLWQKVLASGLSGLIMFIIALVMLKLLPKRFRHKPSPAFQAYMDALIASCHLQTATIRVRYSYLNGAVAAALSNTIIIDPFTWNGLENEKEAATMIALIKKQIVPTMPRYRQELMLQIKNLLSVDVQAFIVRHELGHVYYRHSAMRCLSIGIQDALSIFIGLCSAQLFTDTAYTEPYGAMFIAALVSVVIALGNNLIVGTRQEKAADLFAAHYSTKQEREAFIHFIEQLEIIVTDSHRAMKRIRVPSQLLTGHPSNCQRADYIRNFTKQ